MTYFLLILTVIGLSIGQVLLKKSADMIDTLNSPLELLIKAPFIGGVCAYGITAIAWICALRNISLSKGYMFMSLAFIVVPILSHYIFDEPLTLNFWLGVILIISGVLLTTRV